MTELEERVSKAQEAYYNGNPIMSDVEFDELWDQLPADSELKQEVGADYSDDFPKIKHVMLMGSQSKANTAEEMDRFFKKGHSYLAQLKLDGCLDYNTVLETDKGCLKIGEIVENKIQCKVKAYDFDKHEVIFTDVKSFFINQNDFKWLKIKTKSGKEIIATTNHKIFLPELNAFRKAEFLQKGDKVLVEV